MGLWLEINIIRFHKSITDCVSFHHYEKISDINNLREEGFILVHSFRVSVPQGGEGVVNQSSSCHCGQETE
jgi:hypothetical protein